MPPLGSGATGEVHRCVRLSSGAFYRVSCKVIEATVRCLGAGSESTAHYTLELSSSQIATSKTVLPMKQPTWLPCGVCLESCKERAWCMRLQSRSTQCQSRLPVLKMLLSDSLCV